MFPDASQTAVRCWATDDGGGNCKTVLHEAENIVLTLHLYKCWINTEAGDKNVCMLGGQLFL